MSTIHHLTPDFLIGSWYSKKELGKRASLFQASCAIGTLLSQVLQGGVHTTLNGVSNRPGWRWIFIIDAVISFPIAVGAFFMLPDLPGVIKPNWIFSQDDIDLANARLEAEGRKGTSKDGLSAKAIKEIFSTWHIYIFTICYSLYIFMQSEWMWSITDARCHPVDGLLVQELQVAQVYNRADQLVDTVTIALTFSYPTGIYAVQIATGIFFGWVDDKFLGQRRWPIIILTNTIHLIVCALLAALPVYGGDRTGRWVGCKVGSLTTRLSTTSRE